MPQPHGFEFRVQGDNVVISHHGKSVTTLRGKRAARFVEEVNAGDPQMVMARWTGNYKRGNERKARAHPRNAR